MESKGKERQSEPDELDRLVGMIDKLMEQGDGHVSITAAEDSDSISVKTYRSNDCGTKGACCQPTEDAIDGDED